MHNQKAVGFINFSEELVGHMGLTNLLGCNSSDTCVLLSHPQQRCAQDEFDAPKDLAKMVASVPRTSRSGALPQLRKEQMMAVVHAHFE
jgi:hypothetical protein